MEGHFHFTLEDPEPEDPEEPYEYINEPDLAVAIIQLSTYPRRNFTIVEAGFCCQFGCGQLHDLKPEEIERINAVLPESMRLTA